MLTCAGICLPTRGRVSCRAVLDFSRSYGCQCLRMHMHTFNQVSSICALNLHSPIVSLKYEESVFTFYSTKEFRPAHTLSGWAHDLTEPSSPFELGCSNPPPWQKKDMSQCCGYCQSVTLIVLLSMNTARTLVQYTPGVNPKPRSAGIDKEIQFVTEKLFFLI